jgi:hypothetical protein
MGPLGQNVSRRFWPESIGHAGPLRDSHEDRQCCFVLCPSQFDKQRSTKNCCLQRLYPLCVCATVPHEVPVVPYQQSNPLVGRGRNVPRRRPVAVRPWRTNLFVVGRAALLHGPWFDHAPGHSGRTGLSRNVRFFLFCYFELFPGLRL